MKMNQRFYVNEACDIIDALHPDRKVAHWYEGDPKDEISLRERVLFAHISLIVRQLMDFPAQARGNMPDNYYPESDISSALYEAICASHLNTLDPALSLQNRFYGSIKR